MKRKISSKSGIKSWPKEDRPREKLLKEGEHRLSDTELLAILLRTGRKGESALDLAREILRKFKSFRNMSHADISKWREIKGLGIAKIAQVKAAIEIGRRFGEERLKDERVAISSSQDVADILMPRMRDLKREVFKVLLLDSKNRVLEVIEIEEGTVDQASPIIREIFHKALENFSVSIICVHNHPSGDPTPSPEDEQFTRRLLKAGEVLGVNVLDHIIIGDDRYFSFADEGLI